MTWGEQDHSFKKRSLCYVKQIHFFYRGSTNPREMLHDSKVWSIIMLTEEQIQSCHSSSRNKRQRKHSLSNLSTDWKKMENFTCTVSGCWWIEEPRFCIIAQQSCRLQIFFHQFLLEDNFFLLIIPYFLITCLFWGGGFPMRFSPFSLFIK